MIAFGAAIVLIGAGMRLATPFVQALTSMIKQLGDTIAQIVPVIANAVSQIVTVIGGTLCNVMRTAGDVISQVVQSICDGFSTLADGVATVVDAISGGFATAMNAIAGVIESVGTSAKNAGTGFKSVAQGIQMIAGLSLFDIATALAAVATGIGTIATKGANLPQVAAGMMGLMMAITMGSAGITAFNAALSALSGMIGGVVTNVTLLKAAFANFTIPAPNVAVYCGVRIHHGSGHDVSSSTAVCRVAGRGWPGVRAVFWGVESSGGGTFRNGKHHGSYQTSGCVIYGNWSGIR